MLSAGGFGALDCNWEAGGRLHVAVCLNRDSFQLSSRAGVGETGRSQTTSGEVHPCVEVVVFFLCVFGTPLLGHLRQKTAEERLGLHCFFPFFIFYEALWVCRLAHKHRLILRAPVLLAKCAPLVAQWGSVDAHNARPGRLGQGIFAGQSDKGVLYSLFF